MVCPRPVVLHTSNCGVREGVRNRGGRAMVMLGWRKVIFYFFMSSSLGYTRNSLILVFYISPKFKVFFLQKRENSIDNQYFGDGSPRSHKNLTLNEAAAFKFKMLRSNLVYFGQDMGMR